MVKTQEKPQVELDERIICLLAGESGSGKTFFIANLKDAIIYDSDLGGGSAYLKARIERNGSEREEVTSYFDVLNDIKKRVAEMWSLTTPPTCTRTPSCDTTPAARLTLAGRGIGGHKTGGASGLW